jgi:hypothetical protein
LCWKHVNVTSLHAFGDYKVNGLGHSYTNLGDGCAGILVPGRRVWKVKREHVQSAAVVEQADDGSFQLGSEAQLADMMTDIAANFVPWWQLVYPLPSSRGSTRLVHWGVTIYVQVDRPQGQRCLRSASSASTSSGPGLPLASYPSLLRRACRSRRHPRQRGAPLEALGKRRQQRFYLKSVHLQSIRVAEHAPASGGRGDVTMLREFRFAYVNGASN